MESRESRCNSIGIASGAETRISIGIPPTSIFHAGTEEKEDEEYRLLPVFPAGFTLMAPSMKSTPIGVYRGYQGESGWEDSAERARKVCIVLFVETLVRTQHGMA